MIRRRKDVAWERTLLADDMDLVRQLIHPDDWYPMEVFERLGNAILTEVARGDLEGVRLWGRLSAGLLAERRLDVVAHGDPVEQMKRFQILRGSSFDFEAIRIPELSDDMARVEISYYMGARAEEAACYQTLGFCEALMTLADVSLLQAGFEAQSWAGSERTVLLLRWRAPGFR